MDLPPLTYLTFDAMSEGVGLSQVVPYVERLAARGLEVTLHSFEKEAPDDAVRRRLSAVGARWRPHRFRGGGSRGGLARVAQGAALVARAELVHARSDLPAASAMLTRRPAWLWDVRGFWREDRIALGLLRAGSPPERMMRTIESQAARRSGAIVTLSQTAADVLIERYGAMVAGKSRVITTCVDLLRFPLSPLPAVDPVRLLLAGSLSGLYEVGTMLRLVEQMRARRPVELTVLTPSATPWDDRFRASGAAVGHAAPAEMPGHVEAHHVGLSIRRFDVGATSYSAMPTKVGEFLACGRPVVVNVSLGDLDQLLTKHDCGVLVADGSDDELDRVAAEIERLIEDPETPARCRRLAEEHFDVERGVDQLLDAYRGALG